MSKPDWDTSLPGKPPALRDLTVTEDEVRQMLGSTLLLSNTEKWRAHSLASVETYRANLELFIGTDKERFYRDALGRILMDLGRYDEARDAAPFLNDEITELQQAIERPDDEECDCERIEDTLPDESFKYASGKPQPEIQIAHNRRSADKEVWSERHGCMVKVWRCSRCGHVNAHPDIPERQLRIHEVRTQHAQQIEQLHRAGVTITAANWKPDPAQSDAILLKK